MKTRLIAILFTIAYPAASSTGLERLDLSKNVKAVATHRLNDRDANVSHAIDGDLATYWHGARHSLRDEPTDIIITFAQAEAISKVSVTTEVLKNCLRLKDFELYARAGDGWDGSHPLARIKDNKELTVVCEFPPVLTTGLRLRILDTWRPDHAYPRVNEIEVWRAPNDKPPRTPSPSPIPGETTYEALLLDWTMGVRKEYPGVRFDPDKGYLHYARAFADTMIDHGRDTYGPVHSPMFVSILLVPNQKHPNHKLPSIPGQRVGDRAPFGGNLFHDMMLLQAFDLLSAITNDPKYQQAAQDYLTFFLKNCPQKATGLFPWGEHAHWDFYKDAPGHLTHEYLGGVPPSFWEKLWKLDRQAVVGEADGLINHIVDLETFAWNRHASIAQPLPTPRPKGLNVADFPRHGGFYVLLWTFVYQKTGDRKYLDWGLRAIEHGWKLRRAPLNLPPFTCRTNQMEMSSALSLSISLLEAASLLPPGADKKRYEEVAQTYLDSIARMPHKPSEGYFISSCKMTDAPEAASGGRSAPWGAAYGQSFSADNALLSLAARRYTGDGRFLRLAEEMADFYTKTQPPRADEIVPAHVYAAIITLFLDLYDQTRDDKYLSQAHRYARLSIERLYWNGLFRGATGINHYESQLLVGNLVYALVWLHVLDSQLDVKVEPNYFDR